MRTVVVHDHIDSFVLRHSSLVPDESEELPREYLVSGLVQLIDERARHAITKTAEYCNAREARTGNRNFHVMALRHVSRRGPSPGVHCSLVHVAEMDPCLDQPSQFNYEVPAISQPWGRLEMLVPVVRHPPCNIVTSIELTESSDMNCNVVISFDGGYPLLQ